MDTNLCEWTRMAVLKREESDIFYGSVTAKVNSE